MRRLLPLIALLVAACAPDTVSLSYGLEPGRRLEYELRLSADIERTLSDETVSQHVEATFTATQKILEPLPGGGATAKMRLAPRALLVDGEAVEPGPDRAFVVALGADGRVVEIDAPEDGTSLTLGPVSVERLLPRLRPVLPGAAVAPGETCTSDTTFRDRAGRFSLRSDSRLERLGTIAGRDAALVRTTYISPVDRRERFENAVAELDGEDVGVQEAWFALEGYLLRSSGDSVGSYAVTFRPPEAEAGAQPVAGSLTVELHAEMELVEATEI